MSKGAQASREKAYKPTTTHTKYNQVSRTAITPFKGMFYSHFVIVVDFLMG
jgi:hypothetical protein